MNMNYSHELYDGTGLYTRDDLVRLKNKAEARVRKLEAALRDIAEWNEWESAPIARAALLDGGTIA